MDCRTRSFWMSLLRTEASICATRTFTTKWSA
ncbi:hypothetical protein L915_21761 [Phytophthora nicotianae]|uniref:Uncharacterized protein n=1 Tax=Phytophthora nicotianae TaxID=4792 RepID=W2FLL7_PHYNI|nr:hypothetical protein L915_21761 [Phytophthora nicotianae]